MTTAIALADLLRFIEACGHQPRMIDLGTRPRRPAQASGAALTFRHPPDLPDRTGMAMLRRAFSGISQNWT